MGSKNVEKVTDENFDKFLKENPRAVVDFWAPWCGPCVRMAPIVEELSKEYAGSVRFAKLNTDENPKTASRFGIMSIPTLIVFKNGKPVGEIIGLQPKSDLREQIDKVL